MKKVILPIVLIAITAFLMIAGPEYGIRLRNFLAPQFTENNAPNLASENEELKAELAELQNIKAQLPDKAPGYIRALVYARAPLNFKNEFLINVGGADGASADRAVIFGGMLMGKIEKVYGDTSLVLTVFDSRFQTPVRVGGAATEALFKGGTFPSVSLIPAESRVAPKDIIYAASPDFPYGLPIGEVENVRMSADQLFREASVKFTYDINSIATVLVSKK